MQFVAGQSMRELVLLMKPRITLLSVATAATGLWLAPGSPSASLVMLTLVGTLLLVGAASTLNMYFERDVDGLMARTRNRPLPAGRLQPRVAFWFGIGQALVAIPMLALGTNPLTGVLGAFSLLTYVWIYTPLKRKTVLSLPIGAIPGAMPPLLGWTAATAQIELPALLLFAVVFFWQLPHFLAIALFRKGEYVAAGLKIMPAVNGEQATKHAIFVILVLQVLVTLLLVPAGIGGHGYLIGASLLGAIMLSFGYSGLHRPAVDAWARKLFILSVIYLPVLFALLFL
ncbi:MAG: protoheme IX farnesyltransferase [Deltaproteobacteria bacterium]|nr:protoheme IX farnesyltransferase [Deltaproteobacteria bacterium]